MKGAVDQLFRIANDVAMEFKGFNTNIGPGSGNRRTSQFEKRVSKRMVEGGMPKDDCEYVVCNTRMRADYYFENEATIVEIALKLRDPNTEFEKDVFKAILLKNSGKPVDRLVFICKPGGAEMCGNNGRKAIIDFVKESCCIEVEVHDLKLS